jgi:hypothetical protein
MVNNLKMDEISILFAFLGTALFLYVLSNVINTQLPDENNNYKKNNNFTEED